MGSPISPIIADIVMEVILDKFMKNITHKPRLLTKYVDDIFAVVRKTEIENTLNELNKCNGYIKFTKEEEREGTLPYLDTLVVKNNNTVKTDWFQKPTASGRLINFHSKHPKKIILNTAKNFIRRVLNISDEVFHGENKRRITKILLTNDFPLHTINLCLKTYKDNNTTSTDNEQARDPKIYKAITYVPGFTEKFRKSNIYNNQNFALAPKTNNTLKSFHSKIKEKVDQMDKSDLVYEIKCKGDESHICKKVYVGTTKSKLKTRLSAHRSDLKSNHDQKTALAAHCLQSGHSPDFENTKILQQEKNYVRRYTLEMLHIINTPTQTRLNYKTDTDNCAHIYKYLTKHYTR